MFDSLSYYGSVALAIYKALAFVVTVISILGIAYVAKKSAELRNVHQGIPSVPDVPEEFMAPATNALQHKMDKSALRNALIVRWKEIVDRLGIQKEKDYKSAIIEADALVSAALHAEGFLGETMADRIRAMPLGRISHVENLWRAHKVRNDIAHDPHYIVSPREGHDTMKIYKNVLDELW